MSFDRCAFANQVRIELNAIEKELNIDSNSNEQQVLIIIDRVTGKMFVRWIGTYAMMWEVAFAAPVNKSIFTIYDGSGYYCQFTWNEFKNEVLERGTFINLDDFGCFNLCDDHRTKRRRQLISPKICI